MQLLGFSLLLILAALCYCLEEDQVIVEVVEPRLVKRRMFVPLGPLLGTVRKPKRQANSMVSSQFLTFCAPGDLFITGCFCCGEWQNRVCHVNANINCESRNVPAEPHQPPLVGEHPLMIVIP